MSDAFFRPVSGQSLPRFAGVPSFMRLPVLDVDHPRLSEVEVGLIGIPFDGATSNRPGARHGPRQLRDASTMLRPQNGITGQRPFEAARCADLGDVAPNPVDVHDTMARITAFYQAIHSRGIRPLSAGGDHLTTLPVLRALAAERPVALIQFDSHMDVADTYYGDTRFTHGTPFRRAIEEGLLIPDKIVQIGIRGTCYDDDDMAYAREVGITVIDMQALAARGVSEVMAEARAIVGAAPCYVSYDIDFVDPAFAPGTGTPEVGGPSSLDALAAARGVGGLDIIGADLMEVSPPLDPMGATAWLGASVMFELLCAMTSTSTSS